MARQRELALGVVQDDPSEWLVVLEREQVPGDLGEGAQNGTEEEAEVEIEEVQDVLEEGPEDEVDYQVEGALGEQTVALLVEEFEDLIVG